MTPREGRASRGRPRSPRRPPTSAAEPTASARLGADRSLMGRSAVRQFVPDALWPVYDRLRAAGLPAREAIPFLLIALYFQWKALWTEPRWATLRARLRHDLDARIAALRDSGFPQSAVGELAPLLQLASGPLIRRPTGGPRGGGRKGVPADRVRMLYGQVIPRLSTLWAGHTDADPEELARDFLREWPDLTTKWPALQDRLFAARAFSGWLCPVLAAKLGCRERTVAARLRRLNLPLTNLRPAVAK